MNHILATVIHFYSYPVGLDEHVNETRCSVAPVDQFVALLVQRRRVVAGREPLLDQKIHALLDQLAQFRVLGERLSLCWILKHDSYKGGPFFEDSPSSAGSKCRTCHGRHPCSSCGASGTVERREISCEPTMFHPKFLSHQSPIFRSYSNYLCTYVLLE